MRGVIHELKKRNVIRVALMYLSVAWLLMQLVTTLDDLVGLPDGVGPVLLVVLAVGFVVAILLSWHFDVTADGIRTESEIRNDPGLHRLSSRSFDLALIVVLVLALGYFVWESRFRETAGADLDIAVLPVRDLSADGGQAWFAAGLTEELNRALVAIPSLRVIGRSTAAKFDPAAQDARQFGKLIGVSHVIDSSVNTDGNRVRVTSQLVRVTDGITLWSDAFDDDLANLLKVQDRIATQVTRSLETHLVGTDTPAPVPSDPDSSNFAAYKAFLQGRYHLALRTPEHLDRAVEYFEESLALDPGQSRAHSALAAVYAFSQFYSRSVDPLQMAVLAQRHAREALALDDNNAEAHAVLGTAYLLFDRNLDGARDELGRAYQLAPGDADILNVYGDYFYFIGDFTSALEYEARAARLDPLSATNQLELGLIYGFLGQFDKAVRQAELAAELNPELANAYWQQVRLRLLQGEIGAARALYANHAEAMGPGFAAQAAIRLAMADGRAEEAARIARERAEAARLGQESLPAAALMLALAQQDSAAAEFVELAFRAADGVLNSPMYFFLPEDWSSLPLTSAALDQPAVQDLYRLRRSFREP